MRKSKRSKREPDAPDQPSPAVPPAPELPPVVLGRPSKYLPQYGPMLVEHMGDGFSFESFAAVIGTHRDTLYEWAKVHTDFSDAKKIARERNLLYFEKIGQAGMMGAIDGFSPGTWIFQMKVRHRWIEPTDAPNNDDAQALKAVLDSALKALDDEAAAK